MLVLPLVAKVTGTTALGSPRGEGEALPRRQWCGAQGKSTSITREYRHAPVTSHRGAWVRATDNRAVNCSYLKITICPLRISVLLQTDGPGQHLLVAEAFTSNSVLIHRWVLEMLGGGQFLSIRLLEIASDSCYFLSRGLLSLVLF